MAILHLGTTLPDIHLLHHLLVHIVSFHRIVVGGFRILVRIGVRIIVHIVVLIVNPIRCFLIQEAANYFI